MAIPKLTKESIIEALKYIDEHGVLGQNESTVYVSVEKSRLCAILYSALGRKL